MPSQWNIPSFLSHLLCLLHMGGVAMTHAQDTAAVHSVGMFFPTPRPAQHGAWSLGFVTFTTPEDLTEEVRVRIPAVDVHVQRYVHEGISIDGRLLAQGVQNHLSVGARWALQLNDRFTLGVGDAMGYWRGNLPIRGFDCRARGWVNYPSLSLGFRSRRDLLFTARGELLVTVNTRIDVEGISNSSDAAVVSGTAFSLYMEQPFFKRSYVTLGFTLTYTDFLWATWSLFQTFERKLFYPQITTALII